MEATADVTAWPERDLPNRQGFRVEDATKQDLVHCLRAGRWIWFGPERSRQAAPGRGRLRCRIMLPLGHRYASISSGASTAAACHDLAFGGIYEIAPDCAAQHPIQRYQFIRATKPQKGCYCAYASAAAQTYKGLQTGKEEVAVSPGRFSQVSWFWRVSSKTYTFFPDTNPFSVWLPMSSGLLPTATPSTHWDLYRSLLKLSWRVECRVPRIVNPSSGKTKWKNITCSWTPVRPAGVTDCHTLGITVGWDGLVKRAAFHKCWPRTACGAPQVMLSTVSTLISEAKSHVSSLQMIPPPVSRQVSAMCSRVRWCGLDAWLQKVS